MATNFEKIPYPYNGDKSKPDLRSYAQKAYDYIAYLAMEAGADNKKYVRNALQTISAFSHDQTIINNQVKMVERRLAPTIDKMRRTVSHLPGSDVFKDGVINTGAVSGTKLYALLKLSYLSGNVMIYGQYGMGKTNLNLCIIPQLIKQGIHVDIFDVSEDYRDILHVPGSENGVVISPSNDRFNPLEPIGAPDDHLQFIWEITAQDFNVRSETREMLYNLSIELYEKFGVYDGKEAPSFMDLREFLIAKKNHSGSTPAIKRKIDTALRTLTYITNSFKGMANCRKGYPLDSMDSFSFVSYEIGHLSEEIRSWYMKIKLRQYHHKGQSSLARHEVFRVIVVDEAKGIFGKSRIGLGTNYIKDMVTRSRSIGCWWIISDQFATELVDFVRAASIQITFQHSVPKEIREIAAGMGCNETQKLAIAQLGRYKALQKITDFPSPYPIITYKSDVQRHINNTELEGLMKNKISLLLSKSKDSNTAKRVRIITKSAPKAEKSETVSEITQVETKNIASNNILEDFEFFLRYVFENPKTKLTSIYNALNLSGRKGNALKTKLLDNGLVQENLAHSSGKGRPSKELELTEKGKEYINEK